jgi:hypothetical protein
MRIWCKHILWIKDKVELLKIKPNLSAYGTAYDAYRPRWWLLAGRCISVVRNWMLFCPICGKQRPKSEICTKCGHPELLEKESK